MEGGKGDAKMPFTSNYILEQAQESIVIGCGQRNELPLKEHDMVPHKRNLPPCIDTNVYASSNCFSITIADLNKRYKRYKFASHPGLALGNF